MKENLKISSELKLEITWLGNKSDHWKVIRGKDLFIEKSIKGFPELPLLASSQKYGVVLKDMLDTRSMEAQKDFENFKKVDINDFVISLRSFEGGIETAYYQGIISPAYTVFNFKILADTNFYKYLFKSQRFIKFLQNSITGIRDGQSIKFKEIQFAFFPFPPKPEQTAIANYLDQKTTAIDKKTALLQQKIETYKKLRKAIINKAVTKGLDNKVELKESEIDWIGKIPKHWELKRIKDVSKLMTGNSISDKENFESNFDAYPYVSTKDIYLDSNEINYDNGIYVPKTDESFKILSKNSVLLCIEGANAGKKIGFSVRDVAFVNKLCGFSVIERFINPKYLFYYIISETFGNYFFPNLNGLIGGVSVNKIKEFSALLPTIKEQRQIAEYLDQKTATIDKIVENLQTQITTLQHLRKVLINDAVTGKIKVV